MGKRRKPKKALATASTSTSTKAPGTTTASSSREALYLGRLGTAASVLVLLVAAAAGAAYTLAPAADSSGGVPADAEPDDVLTAAASLATDQADPTIHELVGRNNLTAEASIETVRFVESDRGVKKRRQLQRRLSKSNIKRITTLDFTEVVNSTNGTDDQVRLICFYDPYSPAFLEVMDEFILASARLPALYFGAVDISVNNFMASMVSEESFQSWQETKASKGLSFRFGKPTFLSVVIKLYRDASFVDEFVEVVSADNLVAYYERQLQPLIRRGPPPSPGVRSPLVGGGFELTTTRGLRKMMLENPGPVLVSCFSCDAFESQRDATFDHDDVGALAWENLAGTGAFPVFLDADTSAENTNTTDDADEPPGTALVATDAGDEADDEADDEAVTLPELEPQARAMFECHLRRKVLWNASRAHYFRGKLYFAHFTLDRTPDDPRPCHRIAAEISGDARASTSLSSQVAVLDDKDVVEEPGMVGILLDKDSSMQVFPSQNLSVFYHSPSKYLKGLYRARLQVKKFIEQFSVPWIAELSPDNSHKFIDNNEAILILLKSREPAKDGENRRLLDAMRTLRQDDPVLSKTLQYTWADGASFGSQFDVKKAELPALVLYCPWNDFQTLLPWIWPKRQKKWTAEKQRQWQNKHHANATRLAANLRRLAASDKKKHGSILIDVDAWSNMSATESPEGLLPSGVNVSANATKKNVTAEEDEADRKKKELKEAKEKEAKQFADFVFQLMEPTSAAGYVTRSGFEKAMTKYGPVWDKAERRRIFAACDKDGDGKLSRLEVLGAETKPRRSERRLILGASNDTLVHWLDSEEVQHALLLKQGAHGRQAQDWYFLLAQVSRQLNIFRMGLESVMQRIQASSGSKLSAVDKELKKGLQRLDAATPSVGPLDFLAPTATALERLLRTKKGASAMRKHIEMVDLRLSQNLTKDRHRLLKAYKATRNGIVSITRAMERRQRERLVAQGHSAAPTEAQLKFVDIPRVHTRDLPLERFLTEFAIPRRPVCITGLNLTRQPWDVAHLNASCGRHFVGLKRLNPNSTSWGRLEDAEWMRLSEFISTFSSNATRREYYLHDWTIPQHCTRLLGGRPPYGDYIMPKYFAGDYLQRTNNGYRHSWPSFFLGANQTESSMHVDSGGTNFWLHLLSGTKEWRVFDRDDIRYLYVAPGSSHFRVDAFRPNLKRFPLFAEARIQRIMQKPGELMYIPAGAPHAVRNWDDITAISMNYVDVSNHYLYLWEMFLRRDYREYELMQDNFPRGFLPDQQDVTFGEFKSIDWKRLGRKGMLKDIVHNIKKKVAAMA